MSDPSPNQKDSTPPKRPITEAIDEVHRELEVRRRIYGNWVSEGKLTYQEARNRGERMEAALQWLRDHPLAPAGYEPTIDRRETKPSPF